MPEYSKLQVPGFYHPALLSSTAYLNRVLTRFAFLKM